MSRELAPMDVSWFVRRAPQFVLDAVRGGDLFIAGGCLRASIAREPLSDFDIFAANLDLAMRSANAMSEKLGGESLAPIASTQFAHTIKARGSVVQFIHRWAYDSAEQLIGSFDFTVACAALWWEDDKWRSACADDFYPDLAAKRLRYTGAGDPGGSVLRLLKFTKRGYGIAPEDVGTLLSRLYSTTGGTSEAIVRSLREVDPMSEEEERAR